MTRTLAITNELEERLLSEHLEPKLLHVRELLLASVAAGDHVCGFARHALGDRGAELLKQLHAHVAIDGHEHAGQHDAQARQAVRAALRTEQTLAHSPTALQYTSLQTITHHLLPNRT